MIYLYERSINIIQVFVSIGLILFLFALALFLKFYDFDMQVI